MSVCDLRGEVWPEPLCSPTLAPFRLRACHPLSAEVRCLGLAWGLVIYEVLGQRSVRGSEEGVGVGL